MSAKTLQIVMPMAGLGSRFAKAGFELPKPLIPVDGLPMFQKALTSLAGIKATKTFTFVIRRQHVAEQQLDQLIQDHLPEARILIVEELTRGAAETVLIGTTHLDMDSPLIAMDCDLWFNSQGYDAMVQEAFASEEPIAGGLLTFPADNPRYSYAEVDEDGNVTRTAEKVVISSHAITGAYFFGKADYFVKATRTLMEQPLSDAMPEYYISYVYNVLLAGGDKVRAADVDVFASFGTPKELGEYEANLA